MSGLFGSFGFGADPFGGGGGGMGGGMGGGGGGGGASPGQFNMRFKAYPPSYMERDNAQVEKGDKIILPQSCLETLSRLRISYPMMFEVTNAAVGRKTHCGVLEFTARGGTVYLPKWMMDNLFLEPGSKIRCARPGLCDERPVRQKSAPPPSAQLPPKHPRAA